MALTLDASRRLEELRDARRLLLGLFGDLEDEQCLGPKLEIVNPPIWEVGHVAWFHERWVLRRLAVIHRRQFVIERVQLRIVIRLAAAAGQHQTSQGNQNSHRLGHHVHRCSMHRRCDR